MAGRFAAGDAVQTPHGKGVVREVRNHGRLVVQVQQRAVVVSENVVTPATLAPRPAASSPADRLADDSPRLVASEIDLHGLRVEEAMTHIDDALNAALLTGRSEVRFIHGRSGGRLRGALHARLREVATVRGFRLDPRNPGVTIASL
jgi:dsDNA-specific endonuclease/ATPase MutS2